MRDRVSHFSNSGAGGLLIALFAFPILPLPITNILFICFSGFTVTLWILNGHPPIWKSLGTNIILAVPFIPYLVEFIIYHNNPVVGFEMEKKLLFFTAPIIFALYTAAAKPLDFRRYLNIFSISILLLSVYTLIVLVLKGTLFSPSSYSGDSSDLRLKFEDISQLHPTYFGFFACIAIFWIVYDFKNLTIYLKWIIGISACILLFVDFLIAAKMSLIILIGGSLLLLYKTARKKKHLIYAYAVMVGSFTFLIVLIPSFRQRIFELKDIFTTNNLTYNSVVERKIIFICSWNLFKSSILTGVGCRNMQQYLNIFYWTIKCYPAFINNYNSHNQFLTLGVNYGIFDVLFFMGSILYAVRKVKKSIFAMILIASTVLIMLTESILERQMGVYFYVLFMLLLYNYDKIAVYKAAINSINRE